MPHPRFDLITRDHVIQAARTVKPKPIQKWSCVVSVNGKEREIPVKQLYMEAANIVECKHPRATPADLIPHFAVARLKKLGFEVRYYE